MADFLDSCNDQRIPAKDFKQTFCVRCRNPQCDLAGWAADLFQARVLTQEDRLLNPTAADLRMPQFAQIAKLDFPNMLREAMALKISEQRGDWSVPEIDVSDGSLVAAPANTTNAVEAAVRSLARAQGREMPDYVPPEPEPEPEDFELDDPEPEPPVEPLPVVRQRTEVVQPAALNTEVPDEGIMIGGGPIPTQILTEPKPVLDPWAAPPIETAKKVKPGAVVRFGGNND